MDESFLFSHDQQQIEPSLNFYSNTMASCSSSIDSPITPFRIPFRRPCGTILKAATHFKESTPSLTGPSPISFRDSLQKSEHSPQVRSSITLSSTLALSTNDLPIYPDTSIRYRFPPISRLSKLHREAWANILRSIVSNPLIIREETVIYRFENMMEDRIFLICLAFLHPQSLRENLTQVKIYISKTLEFNLVWNREKLVVEEGVLAWVTEAHCVAASRPSRASRTLFTLPDHHWAWLITYRQKSKRTIDEISKNR